MSGDAQAQDSNMPPLMKSPAEVRNEIFALALVKPGGFKLHQTKHGSNPVRLVCKQLDKETLDLQLQLSRMTIDTDFHGRFTPGQDWIGDIKEWCDSHGLDKTRLMKNIVVDLGLANYQAGRADYDVDWPRLISVLKSAFHRNAEFRVQVRIMHVVNNGAYTVIFPLGARAEAKHFFLQAAEAMYADPAAASWCMIRKQVWNWNADDIMRTLEAMPNWYS